MANNVRHFSTLAPREYAAPPKKAKNHQKFIDFMAYTLVTFQKCFDAVLVLKWTISLFPIE